MNQFKLVSKYKPAGGQPKAIEELSQQLRPKRGRTLSRDDLRQMRTRKPLAEITKNQPTSTRVASSTRGGSPLTLLGVTGSGKTFTLANVIEKIQKPTLVISHNKTLAAQLTEEFRNFFPNNAVQYFVSYYDYYQPEAYLPQTDTYIEKEATINEEIDRLRNATTHALLSRKDVIVVASVSCIYGLGSPKNYQKKSVVFKVNKKIARKNLLQYLIDMQYKRNNQEVIRNNFRMRGDVLEIYPSYGQSIIRIEFFDEIIEKITDIDPITGKALENLSTYFLFPATHFVLPESDLTPILKAIRSDLNKQLKFLKNQDKILEAQRLEQRTNYDLEMITETGYCNGIENYSSYFDQRKQGTPPSTLLDYFPKDFLTIIDESHITIPQIYGMYKGDRSRKQTLIDFGFRLPTALDNRPLKFAEFEKKLKSAIFSTATPGKYEKLYSKKVVEQIVRPTGLLDPKIEVRPIKNQIDDLISEIKKRSTKKQRVLVTTLTKNMAEELNTYLKELNIKTAYLHHEIDTLKRVQILQDLRVGTYDVLIGINLLREGLDLPEVSLVVILDADKEGFLRSDWSLIQVMGRAARHIDGQAIMYADQTTNSMCKAIQETTRRREIQFSYNQKHNITPKSIQKSKPKIIKPLSEQTTEKINSKKLTGKQLHEVIRDLENQMDIAARNLEFEQAAIVRDQIKQLRKK
ncbi:MAG: excinuclease ABC subunit UvrB [bacterium]